VSPTEFLEIQRIKIEFACAAPMCRSRNVGVSGCGLFASRIALKHTSYHAGLGQDGLSEQLLLDILQVSVGTTDSVNRIQSTMYQDAICFECFQND